MFPYNHHPSSPMMTPPYSPTNTLPTESSSSGPSTPKYEYDDDGWSLELPPLPPSGMPTPADEPDESGYWPMEPTPPPVPKRGGLRPLMLSPMASIFPRETPSANHTPSQSLSVPGQNNIFIDVPQMQQPPALTVPRLPRRKSITSAPRRALLRPPEQQHRKAASESNTRDTLKLRLDLNLDISVEIKARVNGNVTLTLFQ
ncbi:hypothetical protein CYLTODRAFT_452081 [Cylindrobasidium torrendii FP15055 ss-10]|uniref:Uncharacterized protein n=1 Tax=Cylindrobasidium torrendii FP15055 ss-10 TaxID=1314674 RepID=A0A0D7BHV4_9AGAR|nr:hypothetical protein CYLTODRAFT_452081 [Cylindrobasidium torrendii FP15055 ss-10]